MLAHLFKDRQTGGGTLILPVQEQIKAWHRANRKMSWKIPKAAFDMIEPPPQLTSEDKEDGFIGAVLSYGFGDDGRGNSDSVLSAQKA